VKKELSGNRDKIKKRPDRYVDTVFFGNGAVNLRGRGHRGYSKKGVIRACASSIFPGGKRVNAVVFNEAFTSCRCPTCKTKDKMLRKKGVDEENEEKRGREFEKEKKSQPSNGNTSDSDTPTNITTSRTHKRKTHARKFVNSVERNGPTMWCQSSTC